jgi:response regulator RpfG family c-di-GMP phosphodiesterase
MKGSMPASESGEFTRPLVGLCVTPRIDDALGVRRLAIQSDIALTCVPFIDPVEPIPAAVGSTPDITFLLIASRGLDTRRAVRDAVAALQSTPVIAVYSFPSRPADRADALAAGVCDTIDLDASPAEFSQRVRNVIHARQYRDFRNNAVATYEDEVRGAIGEILLREYEALYVLGKASEYKDQETGAHIARVAHYSRLIARMIGQAEDAQDAIFHASALHDVGKLGIPDAILLKPGRLSDDEISVMRLHTTNGHRMLEASRSSYLLTGALIALTHHERYDGQGYPMGIGGNEIPLFGRIVSVADVFDALTTKRPYKEAWTLEDAMALLVRERGHQFDPMLVDAFVHNEVHVRSIFNGHTDRSHWNRLIAG